MGAPWAAAAAAAFGRHHVSAQARCGAVPVCDTCYQQLIKTRSTGIGLVCEPLWAGQGQDFFLSAPERGAATKSWTAPHGAPHTPARQAPGATKHCITTSSKRGSTFGTHHAVWVQRRSGSSGKSPICAAAASFTEPRSVQHRLSCYRSGGAAAALLSCCWRACCAEPAGGWRREQRRGVGMPPCRSSSSSSHAHSA